jgi:hypothetical protein
MILCLLIDDNKETFLNLGDKEDFKAQTASQQSDKSRNRINICACTYAI